MTGEEHRLLRMTIEFDRDSTPIAGHVEQDDRAPQAFEGILELISLVEAARRSDAGSAGSDGGPLVSS